MFIISEISPQFGTDIEVAEQMILQSKLGGANAAKLQLYPADLFVDDPDDYLRDRELSFGEFKRLKEYGDRIGLPVFATAFTEETLTWCEELKQTYYKVAARTHKENPELVDRIQDRKETVFVSVPHDYDTNRISFLDNCIYLYCISDYPTLLEDLRFPDFKHSIFSGFSDHSLGIAGALYAASLGCQYLEKHYTISYAMQLYYEKAHLGAMTLEQLRMIKNLSREFEIIRSST